MPVRRSTGWELGVPRIRQKINNGLPVIDAGIQEKTPVVNIAELETKTLNDLREMARTSGICDPKSKSISVPIIPKCAKMTR